MSDPKIKYDIEAAVSGGADVNTLVRQLEGLAKTLEGDVRAQALASADALRQLGAKQGAIDNFRALKDQAQSAARGLEEAQTAAQRLAQQMAASSSPTRAQAGELQRLRDSVRAAKDEVQLKTRSLEQARDALRSYGIGTDNLSQAERNVRTALAGSREELARLAPAYASAAQQAETSAQQQARSHQRIKEGVTSISQQLAALREVAQVALGGSLVGGLARDVAQTADAYNNLQARIKLVTGEGPAFVAAMEGISAVAQRTSTGLEATGELFTKLMQAGKSLGVSQVEALKLAETVNQAVQLSGASAQAADAAVTQLIQGLQGGALRGDEFNSVMEQSPRLARALADGLGVGIGKLREMAEAGRLTSETVIKALQGQADTVASEFSKLPPTVGRALTNLSNSLTQYIGETDKATGASAMAAKAINALANNLSTIAGLLLDAGQAGVAFVALRLAQHFTGLGTAVQQATVQVVANTAAMKASEAASTGAASGVGRFAAMLGTLKTLTVLGIVTNFKDLGTAIGEGVAKLAGYKDKTEELARADKLAAQITAENAAQRKALADATKAAIEKQFELSQAGRDAIGEFDKLTKQGTSAAEAVGKIGKDFDLSTLPGIRNATAVLDKLAADGKISAGQFQQAWADVLKGQDLAVFETQARAAFSGAAREAERLSQMLDATLRESVRRTGLDFDVLSGGMGKAARSAIGDTEAMIAGLDRLKAQGVDVAQALTASIGRGIQTADSQSAIEALKTQIESVRKALGDKVADGLLDQAKDKANALSDALDQARPGISSLREAMKELGLKTTEALQDTAKNAVDAYDTIKAAGQQEGESYVVWQARKQQAALAMVQRLIEANGGVLDAAIQSRAVMEGLEAKTDGAGRTIVRAMGDGAAATLGLRDAAHLAGGGFDDMRVSAEQAAAAVKALDAINSRYGQGEADLKGRYDRPTSDGAKTSDGFKANKDGSAAGTFTSTLPLDQAYRLLDATKSGATLDMTQAEYDAAVKQAQNAYDDMQALLKLNPGSASMNYINGITALMAATQTGRVNITDRASTGENASGAQSKQASGGQTQQDAQAIQRLVQEKESQRLAAEERTAALERELESARRASQASSSGGTDTMTVNVNLGGRSFAINTASQADAQALASMLTQLEQAMRVAA